MKKFIIAIIFGLTLTFLPTICLAEGVVSPATKSGANSACQGANAATGGGDCSSSSANSVANLLKNVVNILSWLVGIIAVIMVIWGGFSIVTSNGDSQKVGKGRSIIIYALIGLIVVALAQVIVRFVISKFS